MYMDGWGWGWDGMDRSMDLCIYRRWMYGCIQPGFEVVPQPFNKYDGSLKHCNVLYIWIHLVYLLLPNSSFLLHYQSCYGQNMVSGLYSSDGNGSLNVGKLSSLKAIPFPALLGAPWQRGSWGSGPIGDRRLLSRRWVCRSWHSAASWLRIDEGWERAGANC